MDGTERIGGESRKTDATVADNLLGLFFGIAGIVSGLVAWILGFNGFGTSIILVVIGICTGISGVVIHKLTCKRVRQNALLTAGLLTSAFGILICAILGGVYLLGSTF